MHIIAFKIIFSMKKGYVYVWERVSFAGMLFNMMINVIFFSIKRDCESIFRVVSILFECDFKCN